MMVKPIRQGPYSRVVAHWLSVWDAETRARNDGLRGGQGFRVPHGKGRVAPGDVVFGACVEDEELLLLARLHVTSLADDPDDEESVLVEDADRGLGDGIPREIPAEVAWEMEFEPGPDSMKRLPIFAVRLDSSQLQGRAGLQALAEGADALDNIL
jgi:hypothetical protein